ncbi:DUF6164 family protein [Pseudomonadota bacterium]
MAIMLFKLRGVPDDEAEDIREILKGSAIDYYETPPSRWGVSMEAIWLQDEGQLEQARALIDEYQQERTRRVKEEYSRLKQEGKVVTLFEHIKENPLLFLLSVVMIAFIVYVSIMPFLEVGNP